MKHAARMFDLIGDQVEALQARIAQMEDWQKNATAVMGRFQTVADAVKGEPEEVATKDPIDAILAVMARWKQEAEIAVGRANDSGRIAQELQQRVTELEAKLAAAAPAA